MTKNEFDKMFGEKYSEALMSVYSPEKVKEHLKKYSDENGKISSDDLFLQSLLLSADFTKSVLYSVLIDILGISE